MPMGRDRAPRSFPNLGNPLSHKIILMDEVCGATRTAAPCPLAPCPLLPAWPHPHPAPRHPAPAQVHNLVRPSDEILRNPRRLEMIKRVREVTSSRRSNPGRPPPLL
jgi:hypothetical protein